MKNKIKFFSLLGLAGVAVLGISLTSCGNGREVSKKIYGADEGKVQEMGSINLLFKENSTIPYISLSDGVKFLSDIRSINLNDKKYKFELKKDGNNYVISNERGAKCTIDALNQSVTYDDFDKLTGFMKENENPLSFFSIKDGYKALKYVSSDYVKGREVFISLKDYQGLDIYEENGRAYLPLSVFNTLLLDIDSNLSLAYNGTNVFLISSNSLANEVFGVAMESDLGKKFREGAMSNTISKEYIDYYYQSLCFDFDVQYGLKRKFKSFNEFLESYKFKEQIKSSNPKTVDNYTAIALSWLEDNHTALTEMSNLYEFRDNEIEVEKISPFKNKFDEANEAFKKLKKEANITNGISYKGDTVFVTFDEFSHINEELLYPSTSVTKTGIEDIPGLDKDISLSDTAILFNKLYKELNSNEHKNTIKNVVVDLTTNSGGDADGLIYSLSTLIGNVEVNLSNSLSGALNKQVFKADINADGTIDGKDKSLSELGFNIYFLNSSYSFSSANAMPCLAALNNSKVVNLGAKTAGGPCALRTCVTPIGSVISSSGLHTMTRLVDGKYTDIDDGISPDFALTEDQMIDRDYIVQMISKWKK